MCIHPEASPSDPAGKLVLQNISYTFECDKEFTKPWLMEKVEKRRAYFIETELETTA